MLAQSPATSTLTMTDRVLLTTQQAIRIAMLAGLGALVIEMRFARRLVRDWRTQ